MSYNWGIFLARGRTRTQYSTVCRPPSRPRASHWSDPADVATQSATIQQPGQLTKCARVSYKRILTVCIKPPGVPRCTMPTDAQLASSASMDAFAAPIGCVPWIPARGTVQSRGPKPRGPDRRWLLVSARWIDGGSRRALAGTRACSQLNQSERGWRPPRSQRCTRVARWLGGVLCVRHAVAGYPDTLNVLLPQIGASGSMTDA